MRPFVPRIGVGVLAAGLGVAAACGGDGAVVDRGLEGAGGVLTGASASSTSGAGAGSGIGSTTSASSGAGGAGAVSANAGVGGGEPAPFTCEGKPSASGADVVTLEWGGLVRSALVHVPPSYDAAAGAMLVLNFHGFGSDAPQEALLTRMSDASDERGFLVAYPYGVLSSWNAGQCCGTAWADAVDDVGFVRALLDELAERYCVDPRRVFATGMSNGGFLSHRLGCELADRLAAIAPVAGVLGLSSEACQPARPVPVLDIHGTADPLVPYEGGVPLVGWDTGGMIDFPSVAETVDAWRAIDGCGEASEVSYAVGDATCTRWPACAGASEVVACVIDDGGHTWPGGTPIPGLGKTSHDLDATAAMLDFFEAHPMP